jgi:hypothetical protein
VGLLLATILGSVVVAMSAVRWHPRVDRAVVERVGVGALVLCGGAALLVVTAAGFGLIQPWVVPALVVMAVRRVVVWAPLPTPMLWALTVLVMASAYLSLERLFRRLECPGRRVIKPFAEEY